MPLCASQRASSQQAGGRLLDWTPTVPTTQPILVVSCSATLKPAVLLSWSTFLAWWIAPPVCEDPESPDRLWLSVLDWIGSDNYDYAFDALRVVAIGISTGGYYAMRTAHPHADRLVGAVAQGGGSHLCSIRSGFAL